jgi:hypothetical protein
MLKGLVNQCIKEYDWSEEFAARVVKQYEWFINLKIKHEDFDATQFSPSLLVDKVWHLHILDTKSYFEFCGEGSYVHHDPNVVDEYARAKRYYQTIQHLEPTQKDFYLGIWPSPVLYVYLHEKTLPRPVMVISSETTYGDVLDYLEKNTVNPHARIVLAEKHNIDEPVCPFSSIVSFSVPRDLKRYKRADMEKKRIFFNLPRSTKKVTEYIPDREISGWELKRHIYFRYDYLPTQIQLIFNNKVLGDDQCYEIGKDSTIHIVFNLRGC